MFSLLLAGIWGNHRLINPRLRSARCSSFLFFFLEETKGSARLLFILIIRREQNDIYNKGKEEKMLRKKEN